MTPESRAALRAQLTNDEGRRRLPYLDTVGKVTIGVGHNLTDLGLPEDLIDVLLDRDILDVLHQLDMRLPWWQTLDEVRQQVLVNMTFNLGVDGLLGFHQALQALSHHRFEEAAAEILASRWAWQVGARADRLAQMLRTGTPLVGMPI